MIYWGISVEFNETFRGFDLYWHTIWWFGLVWLMRNDVMGINSISIWHGGVLASDYLKLSLMINSISGFVFYRNQSDFSSIAQSEHFSWGTLVTLGICSASAFKHLMDQSHHGSVTLARNFAWILKKKLRTSCPASLLSLSSLIIIRNSD